MNGDERSDRPTYTDRNKVKQRQSEKIPLDIDLFGSHLRQTAFLHFSVIEVSLILKAENKLLENGNFV